MADTDKPESPGTERRVNPDQKAAPTACPTAARAATALRAATACRATSAATTRRWRWPGACCRRAGARCATASAATSCGAPCNIGVSARIFHPEPGSTGLRSKNLQYLEESIAQWVMSRDVLVFMVPTVNTNGLLHPSNITLRHYARHLDGLVLQGGADVSPQTYSEAATRPEWGGDRARDLYELELLHEFVEAGKPVLGICRGCQLINVAFGGSLYQDVATNVPTALAHVHTDYDAHRHAIVFPPGSSLGAHVPATRSGRWSIRSTTRRSRSWGATSRSRRCRTRTASSRRSATSAPISSWACSGIPSSTAPAARSCSTARRSSTNSCAPPAKPGFRVQGLTPVFR